MRHTLRALAALLTYPSAELKEHITEVREAVLAEGVLRGEAFADFDKLLSDIQRKDLLESQVAYCELFDQTRSLSLHLFEHVHGESRERGQAMIDLGQQYVDHGFAMVDSELPDYLPMFLEFLSCLDTSDAREWLTQPAHIFAVIQQRLRERGSNYAAIFGALLALPDSKPDPVAMAELNERARKENEKTLDEQWEETPVDFSTPLQPDPIRPSVSANQIDPRDVIATSRD